MSTTTASFRIEEDALGDVHVPAGHLWGAQTQRSHMNFPIGIERLASTRGNLLKLMGALDINPGAEGA